MDRNQEKKLGYAILGVGGVLLAIMYPPVLVIGALYLIFKEDINQWMSR